MNGMSLIVKKVTQLMAGIIFLYGVYIMLHGHLTPGGGFAGGTIVAGSFILLIVANGIRVFGLHREEQLSSAAESIAILVFLLLATAGMLMGAMWFFRNYLPHGTLGNIASAGVIPIYNLVVGTEVAAALLTIFLGFVIFKAED